MHLFQVGLGSGGMIVLDLLMREPMISRLTLVEPDHYESSNASRHLFQPSCHGKLKIDLAIEWLQQQRPDIQIDRFAVKLEDPEQHPELIDLARKCDLGICAVDSEIAKYHFDSLMRISQKPWLLGEVLSGGIGGWIHEFLIRNACYGCVASHLKRSIQTEKPVTPNYAQPEAGPIEVRIPATKTSISVIASLHAQLILQRLRQPEMNRGFTSMLFSLEAVPDIFNEPFRTFRFSIQRDPQCLICGDSNSDVLAGSDLDAALDEALQRLGHD
jgi:hypothetical protein